MLSIAFATSLALHAWLLCFVPFPAGSGNADGRSEVVTVMLEPPPAPAPPTKPHEPPEVKLGVNAPTPPTETWVGFDQYLQQLAAFAQVEQAAFTDKSVAAAPPPTPSNDSMANDDVAAQAPQPELQKQSPAQPAPAPDAVAEARSDAAKPQPAPPAAPDSIASRAPQPLLFVSQQGVKPDDLSPIDALTKLIEQTRGALQRAATARPGETGAKPVADRVPQTQPQAASGAAAPAKPAEAVARKPATGATNIGAQSDRESDPSSTIDVPREQWRLGKPLAAHGLEIKTRRPEFTILTTLTAWPRNPTCRIDFDRSGVPKAAQIVRSSGDSRIDADIEACLYRWRATGKPLDPLADDQTLSIYIHLLINPEREHEEK